MPDIAIVGSLSSGHDACSPVKCIEGDSLVIVNGKPVACIGDKFQPHGCNIHGTHSGIITTGSSFVFVNGTPVARVGDKIGGGGCPESHVIVTGDSLVVIDS